MPSIPVVPGAHKLIVLVDTASLGEGDALVWAAVDDDVEARSRAHDCDVDLDTKTASNCCRRHGVHRKAVHRAQFFVALRF